MTGQFVKVTRGARLSADQRIKVDTFLFAYFEPNGSEYRVAYEVPRGYEVRLTDGEPYVIARTVYLPTTGENILRLRAAYKELLRREHASDVAHNRQHQPFRAIVRHF